MGLEAIDQFRARFATGDTVGFSYRNRQLQGTLTRTNPKRAVVRVGRDDYTVPYEHLTATYAIARKRMRHIESIHRLALKLMAKHGLHRWRFRFDHSTRCAGSCNYWERTITLSFDLARTGSDHDIRDTILHEIAHALVGKRHNHDAVWKAKAQEIGCTGERTHRLEFTPPRWKVRCENRCWSRTAHRRNTRLVCRKCGGQLVYSAC